MEVVLKGVSVAFADTHALNDVSLEFASGEMVAVIGSSGAGKSTLFRVLTRTVAASGRVILNGEDLFSMSRRELRRVRRGIGTIRQAYDLVPQLSAGMNASLGNIGNDGGMASLRSFVRGPEAHISSRVENALSRVGLGGRSGARTASLSGGQQQRVAVARLLVQQPRLVLADEPVAAVDPVTAKKVLATLMELNEAGATTAINLHDVELARSFPRIVALKNGEVAYDGKPSGLTDARLRDIYSGDIRNGRETVDEPGFGVAVMRGMDGISSH